WLNENYGLTVIVENIENNTKQIVCVNENGERRIIRTFSFGVNSVNILGVYKNYYYKRFMFYYEFVRDNGRKFTSIWWDDFEDF
ncbi:MAG: hypothetical protein LBI06_08355, partial [Treponema sp.]|nr:hypothetical protein [Treponema sp.]